MYLSILLISEIKQCPFTGGEALVYQRIPVGDQFPKRRLLPRSGTDEVVRPTCLPARQRCAGEHLRQQAQALTVGPGLVEEAVQVARFVFDEPQDTV